MPFTGVMDIRGETGRMVGKVICDSVCLPLSQAIGINTRHSRPKSLFSWSLHSSKEDRQQVT